MSSKSSPGKLRNPLSPDLAERLKPESSTAADRHFNREHDHDFNRRRHHRRANKRGRRGRGQPRGDRGPQRVQSKNLVLRPTKGPLLNAPKNSTQFIIDDHETSPFLDMEESTRKSYKSRSRQASSSSSRRVSASDSPTRSPDKIEHEQGQKTPLSLVKDDDDFTLWSEFNERDFQRVYEKAHQEEIDTWDRTRLIEEITLLEKKQKELVTVLAKVDPEMYAKKLQDQLQGLRERNKLLKGAIESGMDIEVAPDSSTTDPVANPEPSQVQESQSAESPDSNSKQD